MDKGFLIVFLVTGAANVYCLWRLRSRRCHWVEKIGLTLVLMVPLVGWLLYLFLGGGNTVPVPDPDLGSGGVEDGAPAKDGGGDGGGD